MSTGPFTTDAVIARLRSHAPSLRIVGSSADLRTALEQKPSVTPAVYVLVEESARPPQLSGPVTVQHVAVSVQLVAFVRSATSERDGAGARSIADQSVIPEVRAALIGWAPGDGYDSLSFSAGRDENYETGYLCFQQVFQSEYRIQHQAMP